MVGFSMVIFAVPNDRNYSWEKKEAFGSNAPEFLARSHGRVYKKSARYVSTLLNTYFDGKKAMW